MRAMRQESTYECKHTPQRLTLGAKRDILKSMASKHAPRSYDKGHEATTKGCHDGSGWLSHNVTTTDIKAEMIRGKNGVQPFVR